MRFVVAFAVALGVAPLSAAAQVPAQTPAPTAGPAEWQRPNIAIADYAAGAKKDLDALERKLADARRQAGQGGQAERISKLDRVAQRLGEVRENWEKLPQTNQANWDTVRRNFEIAYNDLMRLWDEANRS